MKKLKFKFETTYQVFEVPTGHKKIPKAKIFKHKNDRRKLMKNQREIQLD